MSPSRLADGRGIRALDTLSQKFPKKLLLKFTSEKFWKILVVEKWIGSIFNIKIA
jgi:hypothetical protein